MLIDILSALEIVTEKIKDYINKKQNISYGESQSLDASARTIAKNNVGVYVQTEEPADAQDGDIWIDTDEIDDSPEGSQPSGSLSAEDKHEIINGVLESLPDFSISAEDKQQIIDEVLASIPSGGSIPNGEEVYF